MSLATQGEGRRRRSAASAAAVIAGTLLVWLVITAIPAFAATTCTATTITTAGDHVTLNVGTDDKLILHDNAAQVLVSINGAAFAPCPGAAITDASTKWLEIVGSNAGNETVTIHDAENNWSILRTTTVNLGSGTDSLVFEYGAVTPAPGFPEDPTQFIGLRQAGTSIAVDTTGTGTSAEFRIDNAENITVNGGSGVSGLCASRTTAFAACNNDLTTQSGGIAATTADDISLPATAPVTQGINLNGGAGDDVLASGNGNDNFQGGPGSDSVDYEASAVGVTVDLVAATGTGMGNDTLADVQNVNGSNLNDKLTGNSLDNVLNGNAGDDLLAGAAGDDIVNGNAGDDTIDEGAAANGADILSGGAGGPEVNGDTLNYGARTTDITVKAGAGAVSGAAGEKDTVGIDFENYVTGSGNDTLVGGPGDEFFDPGSGTNTVDGDGNTVGGADYLDLSSQTGPATFNLSANAGTATAGTTSDTFKNIEGLVGTSADDVLKWDGTGTLLDFIGGDGVDTVDASAATKNVVINLSAFTGGANGTVENAFGGSGNDTITGNNSGNVLIGNAGNDVINGLGGNDFIEGGLGNDSLDTGPGNTGADTLSYKHAPSGEDIDNQLGFATGGDGQDAIGFFAIILGSDFADTIVAGQTAFGLNQRISGRGGNDNITGSNSSDLLKGGGGNDLIRAGGGDDTVKGNKGNDNLFGSSGDDFLFGGKGFDHGNGGSGADRCSGIEVKVSC